MTAFRLARGSIMTPGVLSSETILVRRDTMEALLCTVRTWWSTPAPPTAGTIVGTFGYLCAPKSWSSTCSKRPKNAPKTPQNAPKTPVFWT